MRYFVMLGYDREEVRQRQLAVGCEIADSSPTAKGVWINVRCGAG